MNVQNMLNKTIAGSQVVRSLTALRAVADSQRHRILCLLIEEPLTPTAVAEKLRLGRTRVYYHLDILKKHGFIAVVDERPVAAMIERTYRALARNFKVDRRMLSATASESEIDDAQATLLEHVAEDLRESRRAAMSLDNQRTENLVSRTFVRVSESDASALRTELLATFTKYSERSDEAGANFELALALFPIGDSLALA
jgi:DNA-binding transcriptional ArsR family regulator